MHARKIIAVISASVMVVLGLAVSKPDRPEAEHLQEFANSKHGLPISGGAGVEYAPDPTTPRHGIEKRRCYASGLLWGSDKDRALELVDEACRDKFVGTYKAKSERSACYRLSVGKRVNFNVRRWHDSLFNLDFATCKKYLRYEIVGCHFGGRSYQGNWRFMSDPNLGRC